MKAWSIKEFKRSQKRINTLQDDEWRKLSISQKLRQVNSILRLAIGMRLDFNKEREKDDVRARWVLLKKGNL
jgi:hypothetical protein